MKKHIANIVTGCRFLGSLFLLFFSVFSLEFYIIYIICGFSDMIDGTIARKTNATTEFGSKIDTIADLAFITVSLIKILPSIIIPQWLWIWIIVIAIIKISNIILGYVSKRCFVSLHTTMNKITGLLLFLLPFTLSFIEFKYSSIIVCVTATFASIQELIYISRNCKKK